MSATGIWREEAEMLWLIDIVQGPGQPPPPPAKNSPAPKVTNAAPEQL